jgi:type I restriction enzyme S subunit
MCTCYLGGTPSRAKSEYWNGDIPWINSGEVNKYRIVEGSEYITELGLKKSATKLLPKKTTVLAITGATLGQVSLLEIEACANQSVIGILENEKMPYEFIYPLIVNDIDKIILNQTGGAQQHINKDNVESHNIIIPTDEVMAKYKAIQAPLFETIANNCLESARLAALRDTLLPKLMKGEVIV